jgi:kynurenine formamidase
VNSGKRREIIDLSQDIYSGMPVYRGLPEVVLSVHATHEQRNGHATSTATPAAYRIEFGDHAGTHVDAISHMGQAYRDQSIDQMPLDRFLAEGLCLDLSHKQLRELIEPHDLEAALERAGVQLEPGMIVLLYTDHHRRAYNTPQWLDGPGLSEDGARWLGVRDIAAFGVEAAAPGVVDSSNRAVHEVCGELGFTHYENLVNLHLLVGRGRFLFIGLPLKIRGGTAGPTRAVAVFE